MWLMTIVILSLVVLAKKCVKEKLTNGLNIELLNRYKFPILSDFQGWE